MKKNIGTMDRVIRLVLAVVLFGLAWKFSNWVLLLAGVFCLYEALASWCALYALIGRNSCPIR
ncbi:MAG: DUF2892 domain-containing protein [Candidatus Moraniibacteriota bacterium]